MVSNESWTPNNSQLKINAGHVCVACNVWADATTNDDGSPTAQAISTSSILACGVLTASRSVQRPWTAPTRRCWPAYGAMGTLPLLSPTRVGTEDAYCRFDAGLGLPAGLNA